MAKLGQPVSFAGTLGTGQGYQDALAAASAASQRLSSWKTGMLAPIDRNIVTGALRPAVPMFIQDALRGMAAPGNAVRGEYNQVQVGPDGSVSQFDPRMMDDAAALAGSVTLGSGAIPRPLGTLDMGVKIFHGSPDPRWLDRGEAFSGANPVTAPSKYLFGSPRKSVAETYAGISDIQKWKAEEGMGPVPSQFAGIRQIELKDDAKVLKVKDVTKASAELGVKWGGVDSLERLLDAAKAAGFDAVQMVMDGGNYAVLNQSAIKKISAPKTAK